MELNEDKILDFLDGSLTGAEEEELLHRLAVSPERRVILKQHLQLRELSAILAKKHNYIVPKVLTAQLFTNLSANGYAGPMYHAATDTDSLRNSLEANIGQSAQTVVEEGRGFRTSSLIFSSVLSFIAGAFLVYLIITAPTRTATGSLASNVHEASQEMGQSGQNGTRLSGAATDITEPAVAMHSNGEAQQAAHEISQEPLVAGVVPTNIRFAEIRHSVELGNLPEASVVTPAATETAVQEKPSSAVRTDTREIAYGNNAVPTLEDINSVDGRNWWDGAGMYSTLENLRRDKGYFGIDAVEDNTPFIRRTTVSLRSGGGKAPGHKEDYTGSLVEFKLSADIGDWFVAKVSFGQFMPYETEALSVGKNSDGVRMLKLVPVLQYRSVVGAELGFRLGILGAEVEAMGGFLTDLRNGFIPRAGIFTTLMLQDNLSLQMGVEGAVYTHDIRPSLVNKQTIFALEHPVLTNAMKETESAGFIGPALELAWHF